MSRPSQITTNYASIDATYPVAGVDNSTQGFRDNFSYIKNGIAALETTVNSLVENSIVKEDDTNVYSAVMDHIFAANINPLVLTAGTSTVAAGNYQINASAGNYQQLTINGNVSITSIANWPTYSFSNTEIASFLTSITIAVRSGLSDSTVLTLSWPTGPAKSVANFKYHSNMPTTVNVGDGEVHYFKIWSATAGSGETFVEYLGAFI